MASARSKIRRRDRALPDAGLYATGEHTKPVVAPLAGADYLLFVVRAGPYDLQTRDTTGSTWHSALKYRSTGPGSGSCPDRRTSAAAQTRRPLTSLTRRITSAITSRM